MSDTLVVDRNGRVYLPKLIRKLLGLEANSLLTIDVDDDRVVLKKVDSVAEFGRGMYRRRDLENVRDALRRAALQ